MKKILSFLLMLNVFLLSSCQITENIENVSPLTLAEVVLNEDNITGVSADVAVYNYLSNTVNVSTEYLLQASDDDQKKIETLISDVNKYLATGTVTDASVLDESTLNYMLLEFSKTATSWQYSSHNTLGYDAATQLYFVDVTYKSTATKKSVLPKSNIVLGDSAYDGKIQQRYDDYMSYLDAVTVSPAQPGVVAPNDDIEKAKFESKWGSIDSILLNQTDESFLTKLKHLNYTGNDISQMTFSGFEDITSPYTLTFRFVLDYKYLWGEAQGLQARAVYLYDYTSDDKESIIKKYTNDDAASMEDYSKFISSAINSFKKAEFSINHYGLFDMMLDYSKYDMYYKYLSDYTYRNFLGFTQKIIGISGNTVAVLITAQNQIRGEGTKMSLPTYQEDMLLLLEVTNKEDIKVSGFIPLSQHIIGEPLSVIRNVQGISDQLLYTPENFTKKNEQGVYDAISSFMKLELSGNILNTSDYNIIDLGISSTAYAVLQNNLSTLSSIQPQESVVFLRNWQQKSNTYCVLNLRELFVGSSGCDTDATISLVNSDTGWKVISYVRTKSNVYSASSIPNDIKASADFCGTIAGNEINVIKNVHIKSDILSDESDSDLDVTNSDAINYDSEEIELNS